MEARFSYAAIVIAACLIVPAELAQAASVRSEHFIVSAPTPDLAQEVCQAAERYRRDLAIEWLGQELPPWRELCPITVRLASGAGGATSFMFDRGMPFGWTMNIQGTRERILDSVLPHEITHTIFATHFGRPLPRWADEGACTTVEHAAERAKQDKFLIEFLHTKRGIPFNQMFAMKEYPHDILPLYSQGYSLTRFLIGHGGKRKFVEYVGEGMRTNNWTAATQKHYNFASLSDLQVTWVNWVGEGSPAIAQASAVSPSAAPTQQVEADQPTAAESFAMARQASAYGWQAPPAQNARAFAKADSIVQPPAPSNFSAASEVDQQREGASNVSRPISDGWYARRRDQARGLGGGERPISASPANPAPPAGEAIEEPLRRATFEQPLQDPVEASPLPAGRKVLMEWHREPPEAARADVRGLAARENAPLH
ncbi:MAG: hypothetical protein L0211_08500 [Planctomycetaceae bacterium]|nr:hypothetical protein [Planctomycetaceae bacterium]